VPRARLNTPDGKTTEWKSQALRAYQRRTLVADALIAGRPAPAKQCRSPARGANCPGSDEFANPIAQASLDRIKPVVEKVSRSLGLGLRKLRLRGIAYHGVVSSPALQRRMIRG
jgi:hypothetical protein